MVYHQECPDVHHLESFRDFVIYAGCALNTVRILQTLRFGKRFSLIEDDVSRFVADMGLNIVVMILFSKLRSRFHEMFLLTFSLFRLSSNEVLRATTRLAFPYV